MKQKTYIALLRGINVSGSKMIRMPALTQMLESIGYNQVITYIQSGNVVFQAGQTDPEIFAVQIHEAIETTFGYDVPVQVLPLDAMRAVLDGNPFLERADVDPAVLHVTFLGTRPAPEHWEKIDPSRYAPDELVVRERIVYLACPGGYGKTKLHNNFLESKLKAEATTRNWKTVQELVRLGDGLEVS